MEKKENDESDKISDLPDAILHHIFSFLNMEEAVRSSVYSKRWRNLWTSLPTLNFEYNYDTQDDKILKFIKNLVDKVFILRDFDSHIQRFSFICSQILNCRHVNTWIVSALRHNLQELVLEILFDEILPPLPTCLFNSKSLTLLKLVSTCSENYSTLSIPDSACLPSLKTLFLELMEFRDEYVINKFFSSCPVLESLTIKDCCFDEIDFKISSLSLKHLVIEILGIPYFSIYGSVKLKTPNLLSFRCKDCIGREYYLEDISSLIKVDIYIMHRSFGENEYGDDDDDDDEYMSPEVKRKRRAQRMLKFLRAFGNVKDLTLSAAILKVVSGSPDLFEVEPTKLCYLTCLRLETWLSVDTIHAIAYLLNISPEMKSLFVEISQITSGSSNIGEYPEAETSSQCLLDNLELVEIRDAVGCVNELYFIKLVLKNAKVLKKMVVYTSKKDSPEREEHMLKFTEKLLTFPKASSNITISVI